MDTKDKPEQFSSQIDLMIQQLARSRANASKWDINILIILFAVLIAEMILISIAVDLRIVAVIAITGLSSVWYLGSMKEKLLVRKFYAEEVESLEQQTNEQPDQLQKQLADREKEILLLASKGYSNKMIGAELGISVNTVKIVMSRIMTKLEANDRTEAVVIALKRKIISLG